MMADFENFMVSNPVRRNRRDTQTTNKHGNLIISNMELNIKDRLYIPVILPKDGTFKEFNTKKEILRKIGIFRRVSARRSACTRIEENGRMQLGHRERHAAGHRLSRPTNLTYLKQACEKI